MPWRLQVLHRAWHLLRVPSRFQNKGRRHLCALQTKWGNLGRQKVIFQTIFEAKNSCPHFFNLNIITLRQRWENPGCELGMIPFQLPIAVASMLWLQLWYYNGVISCNMGLLWDPLLINLTLGKCKSQHQPSLIMYFTYCYCKYVNTVRICSVPALVVLWKYPFAQSLPLLSTGSIEHIYFTFSNIFLLIKWSK